MCKRMFALLALAISSLGTPSWAAAQTTSSSTVSTEVGPTSCTVEGGQPCIRNIFSLGVTTGVYEFFGNGRLVVHFNKVLTTFTLDVTINHMIFPIDFEVFPVDTACVQYPPGPCTQYDFTGNVGRPPHHVPVRGTDYTGLINLTLSYTTPQTVHDPAFGHAPGDSTTFTEDILTSYSVFPLCTGCDPTMDGATPGLSSVVALDKPLDANDKNDTFCFASPQENQTFSVGQEIEVEFQLFPTGPCLNNTGTPTRDKTARLSLSTLDFNNHVVFPRLRNKEQGNKFHFDHEDGVHEFDLNTHKLAPGRYTITIFGSKFSPQSVDIILVAGTDTDDPD